MNTLKYISLILTFSLLMACEMNEITPTEYVAADEAITNANGVKKAVVGCYDALQSQSYYGRNMIIVPDLVADNLKESGTLQEYVEIDNNRMLADNATVLGIWSSLYDAINRANIVLFYVPKVNDMADDLKNNYLGEMRFLRALHYFNLVRLFGKVPLRLTPAFNPTDANNIKRNDVSEVYAAIIDDLLFAEANINNTVRGRATKQSATALLAKVYLTTGQYDLAKQKAAAVIAQFPLESNYSNLFSTEDPAEVIWSVKFNAQDGNRLALYFAPTGMGGRNEVVPTNELNAAFESGDLRKNVSIASENYVLKYKDIATGTDKVIVLRNGEMYLIRAEAELRLASPDLSLATADINAIRARAGLAATAASTKDDLLLAVEKERRVELAFEAQRWFDLVRTNRITAYLPSVTTNQMLFPIPLSEVQASGLEQNTGY